MARHHNPLFDMDFEKDQIAELKLIAPDLSVAQEGGFTFIHITNLCMPEGCTPQVVNALLCPEPRDGYSSRLFLSEQISNRSGLNWNGNIRVLEKNWYAISWQTQPGHRLAEMLILHLKPFRL